LFRITARTVLELGSELISSDIIAFYELIKNGFDAQSKNGVEVRFDIVVPKHAVSALAKQIAKGGNIEALRLVVHSEILESASAAAKDARVASCRPSHDRGTDRRIPARFRVSRLAGC